MKQHHLVTASLLALGLAMAPWSASAAPDNTPSSLKLAADRGLADPAKVITISVQLTLPERARFEKAVAALYDSSSPTYHKWMTDADLARFAPPAEQLAAVRSALESSGLSIVSIDRNGFSLRARGPIANVSRAFNTEIHEFEARGQVFRAHIRNAVLSGEAARYVAAVGGLESHTVRPMLVRAINNTTGKPLAPIPLSSLKPQNKLSALITDQALSPKQTITYTTPGAALPTAIYSGLLYDANGNLTVDFDAKHLQKAYGLPAAYKQGLDGSGQTIVLVEGYGYPNMQADANTFAKLNKLPPLTGANFKVVYPEGVPTNPEEGVLLGWDGEIALDIQSAHSIAPGAKILLVATNGQDSEDFQASIQYIVDNGLGYAASDSWEEDTDLFAGPYEQESFDNVLTVAAAKGVSFQFSTGDSGDGGLGTPLGAPGVPSSAPHGTAVGGTALLNNLDGSGYVSVGWGDALSFVDADGPFDPPFTFFEFGGGGGESVFWPKPTWQAALPGTGRQTPDISALADPFTGFPIVITIGKKQFIEPGVGGTSLASPIFTAIWAIADQKAGHALGQAAPTIAALKSGVIDVLPLTSKDNVSGSLTDSNGTTAYSAKALFKGFIPDHQTFIAALWDQPQFDDALAIAFGLDTSLSVGVGWDNATGYGTPYGLAFIKAAAGSP